MIYEKGEIKIKDHKDIMSHVLSAEYAVKNGTLEMAVIYSADSESKTAIWFDKNVNKVREENGT